MTAFAFLPSMTPSMPPPLQVIERGWVSSNSVVCVDGDDTAVVDTGYGRHAQQTVALVNHALAGRALKRIVNTHTHSDHIGGNAALRRAHPAVRIHIPVGDADVIHHWDEAALHLTAMGQQCERFAFDRTFGVCGGAPAGITGSRDVARAEPLAADPSPDRLRLGGLDWQAIGSPGHDASSQVLYCAAHGVLISADALWENGFGVIFAEVDGASDAQGKAFAAQRATLDTISTLDVRCVIPGHGAPFTNARAALERAYSRLDFFTANPERHARNALKVTLESFKPSGFGWTANIPGFGLLADQFKDPALHIWAYDKVAMTPAAFSPMGKVPLKPFTGVIGVALAEPGNHSVVPPRRVGGNLDIRDLSAGTVLYLPIEVTGALFSVGDTHAAQGDGEVCGTAIESPMSVVLSFDVVRGANLKTPRFTTAGPVARHLDTKGYEVTTGVGPDLMEGARAAVMNMIDLLSARYKMAPVDAYMLCSVCGDLRISEIVDQPNWVVSFYFPRVVLE